jgi:anti-sigma regulatory factor (Ser/Thr protein kinase)
MPVVRLVIPAISDHARTARLVAGSAARRAGVRADILDDVRLAVAEAVALSVQRAVVAGGPAEVELAMADDGADFTVTVSDGIGDGVADGGPEELSLPLIRALCEECTVRPNPAGSGRAIGLRWSTGVAAK